MRVGKHLLVLNGRVTIGPQFWYVVALVIAVSFATVLVLKHVVSGSIVLTIFFLVIAKAELVLVVGTALTEPGIIPPSSGVAAGDKPATSAIINGVTIERKWCHSCNHHMPPRAKHCGTCHCCIDRHDHHCRFLSNCVGIRNYRSFVLLLVNSLVYSVFVVVVLLVGGVGGGTGWGLLVVSSACALILGQLVVYHLRLVLKGSTSYEQFKGFGIEDEEPQISPFSLGSWQVNLNAFLTSPTEPSRVTVKDIHVPNEELVSVLGHERA